MDVWQCFSMVMVAEIALFLFIEKARSLASASPVLHALLRALVFSLTATAVGLLFTWIFDREAQVLYWMVALTVFDLLYQLIKSSPNPK